MPDDFGVIGFANELFGQHITPALSTVDQQTIQMGKSAIELLMDLIEKKEMNGHRQQKVVLEPLLIFRNSSARNKDKS